MKWYKYLLPWNWCKCCTGTGSEPELEALDPHTGERYDSTGVPKPIHDVNKVPDGRVHMTEEADACVTELLKKHNDLKKPTPPFHAGVVYKDQYKYAGPEYNNQYHVYLRRGKSWEHKFTKVQPFFSSFGSNKDFLSYLFGQEQQAEHELFAGTEDSMWELLRFVGTFGYNRVFCAVHKKTGDEYVIVTNYPWSGSGLKTVPLDEAVVHPKKLNFGPAPKACNE